MAPEEPWMYQQNALESCRPLTRLETSHYTTMLIGNDSVGALAGEPLCQLPNGRPSASRSKTADSNPSRRGRLPA